MGQQHSSGKSLLTITPFAQSHNHPFRYNNNQNQYLNNNNNEEDITSKFHEVVPDTYEKIKRSSKYKLPSDDEIMGRIQLRHFLFRYVWQSNFSSPIDEKLRNGGKVLDIG